MSFQYTSVVRDAVKTGVKVGNKFLSLPEGKESGNLAVPRLSWLSSDYPTDIFSRPGSHESKIPKIDLIEHLVIRAALTISTAPVTLVPSERWFEQQDLNDPGNPSVPIQTHYDDTAQANLLTRATNGTQRAIFKTSNIESDTIGKYAPGKPLMPGTHYFYIPLMSTIFANFGGLYLGDMVNELRLVLKVPSTIIASGSGTISNAVIQFGVEGHILNNLDRVLLRKQYQLNAANCLFLQPHRSSKQMTLTCGSDQNYIDLNDVRGVISHHMILVRPSGSTNANNGRARFYNLGDYSDARISLVDNQGTSITGSIPTRYMRQHMSTQFDCDWVSQKPVYLLQYCHNINEAFSGKVRGGRYFFPQSGDRIQLTLPAAATSEVQTVTFSATPASAGFYRFRFRGEESAYLVGNASIGAMKTAFEAMRGVDAANLTVTFSAIASAGSSLTATFNDPQGILEGDLFEIVAGDAFAASASTVRTTAGIVGLPATGAYEVTVFSYQVRMAEFTGNLLYSKDMMVAPPSHTQ
jgi:hypothetical protein